MIYYPDMRDHLRPCPFCGGKVKRTSVWNREKDQITQKVECWECNVTLSRTGPMRDEHALRLWVIRHWNLRLDKTQGPAWRDTLNEFEQECQACWKKIEDDFIRFTCEIRDYDRRVEKSSNMADSVSMSARKKSRKKLTALDRKLPKPTFPKSQASFSAVLSAASKTMSPK